MNVHVNNFTTEDTEENITKAALINSAVRGEPFDKLRANGINQSFPNEVLINYNIVIPANAGSPLRCVRNDE